MSGGTSAAALAAVAASTLFAANAAREEGKQRLQAAEYTAQQADAAAGQQQAAAQRQAAEERRKSQYAQSRALALAAASGDASSPGVVDIISDLAGEGEYRRLTAMYEGEDRARALRQQAASLRYGGAVAYQAGKTNATASILRGASSMGMLSKYSPPGGTQAPAPVSELSPSGGSFYDAGSPLYTPYG